MIKAEIREIENKKRIENAHVCDFDCIYMQWAEGLEGMICMFKWPNDKFMSKEACENYTI